MNNVRNFFMLLPFVHISSKRERDANHNFEMIAEFCMCVANLIHNVALVEDDMKGHHSEAPVSDRQWRCLKGGHVAEDSAPSRGGQDELVSEVTRRTPSRQICCL